MTRLHSAAHATAADAVARELSVDPLFGLKAVEIETRRERFGANVLPRVKARRAAEMLLDQLVNVVVLLLVTAAVISWVTHDHLQAVAILIVLALNTAAGFFTEWQAGRALDALRKETRISATVRRDGHIATVAADDLVVGDVVLLSAGDRIPADLRVIESANLRTEEAPLTGESKSVFKSADVVRLDSVIAERSSMLFLGTVVTTGRATAVVVSTGSQTELGKIGRLVIEVETERTPLQRKLEAMGQRLVYLVLAIAAIVIVTGLLRGEELWSMVEVGISLAVAAVPEALPAVTTFILAFGVLRMARRNAVVRRLSAVETLGSTTVICTDKTGTLTMNRMTVVEYRAGDRGRTDEALLVATLCNEATDSLGDPTEVALVVDAKNRGMDFDALRSAHPRVAEQPFDSTAMRMVTVHGAGPGEFLYAMKGAAATVLAACDVSVEERANLMALNEEMARSGERVLALASKRSPSSHDDLDRGYAFAAFVGLTDPPRPGVRDAIDKAKAAGIRVIMLTGDQVETARAVARNLHISDGEPVVVHARDIGPGSLLDAARSVDAFARVSPEEKYRIVEALQNNGEIVAVTGDGVNDAPALKKADVGVAMGERGTEVAKEAADIVLTDDDFTTIVSAIEGGRSIFANIIKFVHMMFSHNLSEVVTIFMAIAIGWPLPLLPLQILWLNLVTDIFPAFALALEPPSPRIMSFPPRSPSASLLSSRFLTLIVWQGLVLSVITLGAYRWALNTYGPGEHARTVALLALIGVQIGHTFNCRSRTRSAFAGLTRNRHLWFAVATVMALQSAAFLTPVIARVLGLVTPNAADIAAGLIAIAAPVLVVEIQKAISRSAART
jgi:Ca2+-transporting ATPase